MRTREAKAMRVYFFLAVSALLAGCDAFRMETDVPEAQIASPPECVLYVRKAYVEESPSFSGTFTKEYSGDILAWNNEASQSSFRSLKEKKYLYCSVSLLKSSDYLPSLNALNEKGRTMFPALFAETPEGGIPAEATVSLDSIQMKDLLTQHFIGASHGMGEKLNYTLRFAVEDVAFQKHELFQAGFTIQHQVSLSSASMSTKVFPDLKGEAEESYHCPFFFPFVRDDSEEYREFLETAILNLIVRKLNEPGISEQVKMFWRQRKTAMLSTWERCAAASGSRSSWSRRRSPASVPGSPDSDIRNLTFRIK